MKQVFSMHIKYIHIFVLFCITASLSAQKIDFNPSETKEVTINYGDSMAIVEVFTLPQKIKVEDNKKYYWYYLNELHSNLGGYQGKLLHGAFILLDKNNNMITKGFIKQGLKDGEWKRWYPNGNLSEIRYYDEGIKKGTHVFFDVNGTQIRQEKYKNGTLQINSPGTKNQKTKNKFSIHSLLKNKVNKSPTPKENRKIKSETKNDTLIIQKSNSAGLKNTETDKKSQPKKENFFTSLKKKFKQKKEDNKSVEIEEEPIIEKEKSSKKKILQINAGKLSTKKDDKKEN
ncbi:MAG: hypothetical protein ABF289_16095 [Clostridiales bacterium]